MYKIFLFYCLSAEMTSEAFIRYEKKLADEVARIAFRRTVINTFSVSLGTTNFQHIIYFLVIFHAEYLLVNDLIIIFSKIHLTRTRLALCLPALKILF